MFASHSSYSSLPESEGHDSDSQETLLEKAHGYTQSQTRTRRSWSKTIIRVTIVLQSVLIVILIAAVVLLTRKDELRNLGDLIPYAQRTFTNPIYPKPDLSGLEIQWEEDAPRYVGTPRAELDDNWDELLSVTTFNLSGPVSLPAHGHTHAFDDGNFVMGLEVYHALHCVNAIRMYIFPENYEFREKKSETELHKHHCIDYLRQYIQCNADLTPMDFSKIQEWIEENVAEGQRSGEVL
ncbi:hypothetical protein AC578_2971 [Pseudocercospora eumusae]|uniref:Uncharacterized protein n=1 Tax=Pseudocercospora eumusae TaxID=321146 RepID=A0A139HEF7_9PEZI|nr:hypothetical protein AC578_2971 [Pseudocercospora eumusae]